MHSDAANLDAKNILSHYKIENAKERRVVVNSIQMCQEPSITIPSSSRQTNEILVKILGYGDMFLPDKQINKANLMISPFLISNGAFIFFIIISVSIYKSIMSGLREKGIP